LPAQLLRTLPRSECQLERTFLAIFANRKTSRYLAWLVVIHHPKDFEGIDAFIAAAANTGYTRCVTWIPTNDMVFSTGLTNRLFSCITPFDSDIQGSQPSDTIPPAVIIIL
jgi:hypothetical protein